MANHIHILNIEPNGFSRRAQNILQQVGSLDMREVTRQELLRLIPNYEVLITRLGHNIDFEVLEKGKKLIIIASATTGENHLAVDEAKKRGIHIVTLKGETEFLDEISSTAEHTIALLLSLIRHIPWSFYDVLQGRWRRDKFKGAELKGKTIGIVGLGRLGRKVALYSRIFGMRVIAYDKYCREHPELVDSYVDLNELLRNSDIISVHVPLNSETTRMFSSEQFKLMKKNALFINTSRGEVVDENALLDALVNKTLAGAAIDVMVDELKSDFLRGNPLLEYAKQESNLLITPHIGGVTTEAMERTEVFIAEKIVRIVRDTFLSKRG